jgi:KipI family sensor histidine kinase inhibitor
MSLLLDGFKAHWTFVNENSLLIRFAEKTHSYNPVVASVIVEYFRNSFGNALLEVVPSYETVFVEFNPLIIEDSSVSIKANFCIQAVNNLDTTALSDIKQPTTVTHHKIPVLYDLQVAPDIQRYLDIGISLDELIHRHTSEVYKVYAVGFSPGFAFMGTVQQLLQLPRHTHPRAQVLAGSVAIAENQTAIYPQNTPGGWNIIGHCPISIYDPMSKNYGIFKQGDSVTYHSISQQEYIDLGGNLAQFNY